MRASAQNHRRAKTMRKEMSLPEVLLWTRIRRQERGAPQFRRQHPLGPYYLDFFCAKAALCVEVDGASHGFGDRPQRDEWRDAFLNAKGIRVLRIPAQSVLRDPESVANWVLEEARSPPQSTDLAVR
ncbi:MAG: endonuclease domain-containing protein [Phenylobacterium sp.]